MRSLRMDARDSRLHAATAAKTSEKSKSLRVYLPQEIAEEMGIEDGDVLGFIVDKEDGEIIGKFKKMNWKKKS